MLLVMMELGIYVQEKKNLDCSNDKHHSVFYTKCQTYFFLASKFFKSLKF